MKVCCIVSLVFSVIACGCTSYRMVGLANSAPKDRLVATSKRYRVAYMQFKIPRGLNEISKDSYDKGQMFVAPNPWSLPQGASLADEEILLRDIQKTYPTVFSEDTTNRLAVRIVDKGESIEGQWSFLCPYLITLGIFPAFQTVHSSCSVEVYRADNGQLVGSSDISCESSMRLSVSPVAAMFGFDREGSVQSQATGAGVMEMPHTRIPVAEKARQVFAEVVADAIVSVLLQSEVTR